MTTETGAPQPEKTQNEQVRDDIMNKYDQYLKDLAPITRESENRKDAQRLAVVVSLWEEDGSGITAKLYEKTLKELYKQAAQSGLQLDVFMVANSSGGPTPEIAAGLQQSVAQVVEDIAQDYGYIGNQGDQPHLRVVDTVKPATEGTKATEAWAVPLEPLTNETDINSPDTVRGSRFWYIKQQQDPLNSGKPRALRDMSAELYKQMTENKYAPDAVLMLDGESLFKYSELFSPLAERTGVAPLKALVNNLLRRGNAQAVGASDNFSYIDSLQAVAKNGPRPAPHQSFFLEKKEFKDMVQLPGAGSLCRPEVFVAGYKALSEVIPSHGDDIALSRVIRTHEAQGKKPEDVDSDVILIANIVTVLNRIPDDIIQEGKVVEKGYLRQLRRWVEVRKTLDQVFPPAGELSPNESKDRKIRLTKMVVMDRIKHILKGDMRYADQLVKDIMDLSDLSKNTASAQPQDILAENNASWSHTDASKRI